MIAMEKRKDNTLPKNEREGGRWAENIASISDISNQLKSCNHIQGKLVNVLRNYQIEVKSIDSVKEESLTRFRLHLMPGQDNDIIRKMRCDIAISLGLKRIDVNITQEYAELVIPNSLVY